MEGPLAKQNPSAPHRYSIRTFVLDGTGLRFQGARRSDGEAPTQHRITMDEVASLCLGNGDAAAKSPGASNAAVNLEGEDFQIRLKRDGGLCLQLRARSREEAFRWLLALSEASGVRVDVPHNAGRSSGLLPSGWEAVPVPSTGQCYFCNTKTQQRQWTPPTNREVVRSTNRSTGVADRVSTAEAAADAARLDAEIKEMKAARQRRKRGGLGAGSEAPTNEVVHGAPSAEPSAAMGDSTRTQPELSRRGLELQASIADLSSRRQARRQRRRNDRQRALWNAGATEDHQRCDAQLAEHQPAAAGTPDPKFASLSTEERVAARMAQLLQAAFPDKDAHSRVCSQIASDHETTITRRQMAKAADSSVHHSHPVAPVPTFADGAFVSAAIVDTPTRTNTTQHDHVNQRDDSATAALQAELERLRPSELRRRALRARIPASVLGEAQDSSDPKGNMISLLIQYELTFATAPGKLSAATVRVPEAEASEVDLVAEGSEADLVALRPSELRRRATALGVERSKLDEAQDSIRPKQAIAQLILAEQRRQADQDRVKEQQALALVDSAKADVVAAQEELRRTQAAAADTQHQLSSLQENHAQEAQRREHAEARAREIEAELAEARAAAAAATAAATATAVAATAELTSADDAAAVPPTTPTERPPGPAPAPAAPDFSDMPEGLTNMEQLRWRREKKAAAARGQPRSL